MIAEGLDYLDKGMRGVTNHYVTLRVGQLCITDVPCKHYVLTVPISHLQEH